MTSCSHCRKNLLPLLYDLLDDEEALALREHLDGCDACQGALEDARKQKAVLAAALKESFPGISFQEPREGETQKAAPRRVSQPVVVALRKPWRRLALAASIVVAALGLGSYLAYDNWQTHVTESEGAESRFAAADQKLKAGQRKLADDDARLQVEIDGLQKDIATLVTTWRHEKEKTVRAFEQNETRVLIDGPASLQAGAKNELTIEVRRPAETLPRASFGAKPLHARVINAETKDVLLDKELSGPRTRLTLPPDLPLKAGARIALVVQGEDEKGAPLNVVDHLALAAPEYVTHLFLDRPMARPGETIRFRSLTLERFSLKPAEETMRLRFALKAPDGNVLAQAEKPTIIVDEKTKAPILGPDGRPVRGLAVGELVIPLEAAPGPYVVEVADLENRFAAETRRLAVESWTPPLLLKELHFDKKSYGQGEEVTIRGSARRAAGKPEALPCRVTVSVDGVLAHQADVSVDEAGKYRHTFCLPGAVARGDASVSVDFVVDGVTESITRPLPVVVDHVLVDFYPEGGNLIVGAPSRIYFQARTPLGKPADVSGLIIDDKGNVVATAQTLTDPEPGVSQGMGLFQFTPRAGMRYRFRIDTPKKLTERVFALPEAVADGVALQVPGSALDRKIDVTLYSTRERELLVGAYCRGKLLDHATVKVDAKETVGVELHAPPGIGGVYRVTVFEKAGGRYLPLAERLVYNDGKQRLDIGLTPAEKTHGPRAGAKYDISVRDEQRAFAPSILLVAVTDLGLVKMADDRTARSMPSHFLLTSEVRRPQDLENVDVLLGEHPKAAEALDLLLGVQGWRRFAEQDPAGFLKRDAVAALGLLPGMTPARRIVDSRGLELEKRRERHATKYLELQKALAAKERALEVLTKTHEEVASLQQEARRAAAEADAAQEKLADYGLTLRRVAWAVGLLALLFTGLIVVRWGLGRIARGRSGDVYVMAGAAALGGLMILTFVAALRFLNGGVDHAAAHKVDVDVAGLAVGKAALPGADIPVGEPVPAGADSAKSAAGAKSVDGATPPSRPTPEGAMLGAGGPKPVSATKPPLKTARGGGFSGFSGGFMPDAGGKGGGATVTSAPGFLTAPLLPFPVPPGMLPGGMSPGVGGMPATPYSPPAPPSPPAAAPVTVAPAIPPPPGPAGGGAGGVGPGGMFGGFGAPLPASTPRMIADGSPRADAGPTGSAAKGTPARPTEPVKIEPPVRSHELPRDGRFGFAAQHEFFRELLAPELLDPCVLREYAHVPASAPDQAEVLLWRPVVVAPDGRASVEFAFSDLITTYEMTIFAHGPTGRLGGRSFLLPMAK